MSKKLEQVKIEDLMFANIPGISDFTPSLIREIDKDDITNIKDFLTEVCQFGLNALIASQILINKNSLIVIDKEKLKLPENKEQEQAFEVLNAMVNPIDGFYQRELSMYNKFFFGLLKLNGGCCAFNYHQSRLVNVPCANVFESSGMLIKLYSAIKVIFIKLANLVDNGVINKMSKESLEDFIKDVNTTKTENILTHIRSFDDNKPKDENYEFDMPFISKFTDITTYFQSIVDKKYKFISNQEGIII